MGDGKKDETSPQSPKTEFRGEKGENKGSSQSPNTEFELENINGRVIYLLIGKFI
jgi:hypothetical protein